MTQQGVGTRRYSVEELDAMPVGTCIWDEGRCHCGCGRSPMFVKEANPGNGVAFWREYVKGTSPSRSWLKTRDFTHIALPQPVTTTQATGDGAQTTAQGEVQ